MARTYYKTECRICGDYVSTNGVASASHKKKHVREDKLMALYSRVLDKTVYYPTAQAQEILEEKNGVKNYAMFTVVNV